MLILIIANQFDYISQAPYVIYRTNVRNCNNRTIKVNLINYYQKKIKTYLISEYVSIIC